MKTAPFNVEKALAGHPLITRGGELVTGFRRREPDDGLIYDRESYPYSLSGIRSYRANGQFDIRESRHDLYLALPDDPLLSPEEQAVIDAMRAGRKVTVEEPSKPQMPKRCWASFHAGLDDPWGWSHQVSKSSDLPKGFEQVQLIELTPEVSTALLAAGIRWEDAPIANPLPAGLPPLPEGAIYLGVGGSFKTTEEFDGWTAWADVFSTWIQNPSCRGNRPHRHYAAPFNSEVARLNSKP